MKLYLIRLKSLLQHRYIIKIITVVIILISLLLINFYPYKSKYNITKTDFQGIVTKYDIVDNKLSIYFRAKEILMVNYYFNSPDEKEYYLNNLSLGDTLYIKGQLFIPNINTIPNVFNYRDYLYKKKIYYLLKAEEIIKIKNNGSVFCYIKNKIIDKMNNFKSHIYLKVFLLGDKSDLDKDILSSYKENGLLHLFSISGMHISLIANFFFLFLKRISYNSQYNYFIVITFLLFYMFLLGVPPSVLRTMVMFILFAINKLFNLKMKVINIMLLTLNICLIINPFLLSDIGFQYSYLISFGLVLFRKKISIIKPFLKRNLYISYLAFLISFPLTIYNFYQVNIIGIILNVIMIPFVSFIIMPLSFLTSLFPFLDNILLYLTNFLENISFLAGNINLTKIVFCKVNIIIILIYYAFIILSLNKNKYYPYLLIIILIHNIAVYFDPYINITMFDVKQGDALLIKFPYNGKIILVDTGGISNSNYKISDDIITYLHSLGKNKIDYLIVTHGDYDHMGEAINLVENFKVEKVIFNCGEFNELEQELIKVLDKKKITYYSCIKELSIDDNKLYFLNNKDYGNENDNSSVIYTELNNHKFLFMGDAGVKVEEDLIEKYNLQNIDVLKVGHHGSKTSSSKSFIDEIKPKYSIISVGKNNRYGHPNDSVLKKLEDTRIYRTDQDGSIMFKIKNNKLQIETCPP